MAMVETRRLPLALLRTDPGIQPRAAMSTALIHEYIGALKAGAEMPPIVAFYDGAVYWVADGFHRVAAAKAAGLDVFPVELHQGTQRDAVLYSVGSNATHGLRRTHDDKRRAVTTLLRDPEWVQWSNPVIAEKCKVGVNFVARMRHLVAPASASATTRRYINQYGDEGVMNITGLPRRRNEIDKEKRERVSALVRDGWRTKDIKAELRVSGDLIADVRRQMEVVDPPPQDGRSYKPFAQRAADIRTLVAQGYTVTQVAAKLGIGEESVVKLAQRAEIDLTAVSGNRKTRRHDSDRIMDHVVMDAENLTADVGLIDMASLNRQKLGAWVDGLKSANRALGRLIARLKMEMEGAHGEGEEDGGGGGDTDGDEGEAAPEPDRVDPDREDAGASGAGDPAAVHPGPR